MPKILPPTALPLALTGSSVALPENTRGNVGNGSGAPIDKEFLKNLIEVAARVLARHDMMLEPADKAGSISILFEMNMEGISKKVFGSGYGWPGIYPLRGTSRRCIQCLWVASGGIRRYVEDLK